MIQLTIACGFNQASRPGSVQIIGVRLSEGGGSRRRAIRVEATRRHRGRSARSRHLVRAQPINENSLVRLAEGRSRHVALTVPHFHAVALTVAESGLIGSLPVHFAERVAPRLELFLPPYDPPFVDVTLFWHLRHAAARRTSAGS